MSSPEIPQPHDSLIRHTFGSPENAASLFRAQLPPSLAEVLNWERIQLESGSFVDAELRRSECDLLFRVPIRGTEGDEALIYVSPGAAPVRNERRIEPRLAEIR